VSQDCEPSRQLTSAAPVQSVYFSDHHLVTCRLGVQPTPPVTTTYSTATDRCARLTQQSSATTYFSPDCSTSLWRMLTSTPNYSTSKLSTCWISTHRYGVAVVTGQHEMQYAGGSQAVIYDKHLPLIWARWGGTRVYNNMANWIHTSRAVLARYRLHISISCILATALHIFDETSWDKVPKLLTQSWNATLVPVSYTVIRICHVSQTACATPCCSACACASNASPTLLVSDASLTHMLHVLIISHSLQQATPLLAVSTVLFGTFIMLLELKPRNSFCRKILKLTTGCRGAVRHIVEDDCMAVS